ncbi:Protein of unknown function [Lactobacillus helveticus CIRM-BIA 953]
MIYWL